MYKKIAINKTIPIDWNSAIDCTILFFRFFGYLIIYFNFEK